LAARAQKGERALDRWAKDLAPSTELRKWFGHDPRSMERVLPPLVRRNGDQLNELRTLARQGRVTLVYSAHDEVHNDAVVLRSLLLGRQIS
jgi:uncharacterized protein YeaO (DUF488 family)